MEEAEIRGKDAGCVSRSRCIFTLPIPLVAGPTSTVVALDRSPFEVDLQIVFSIEEAIPLFQS